MIYLFLLIQLFLAGLVYARQCPDGSWTDLDICFVTQAQVTPFDYAEMACQMAGGGHLSSIDSAFTNEILRSTIQVAGLASSLIGLKRDDPSSGQWLWSDGAPVVFLHFDTVNGEPGNDSCALINSGTGKWSTTPCQGLNPFVCSVQARAVQSTCPSGWTYYDKSASCYYKGVLKSWTGAETDCVSRGGHLTSIHSADEATFVTGLAQIDAGCLFCSQLRQRYRMWIGGQTVNGSWAWSDGTPYDYSPYPMPTDRQYYMMVNTDSDCRDDPQSAYGNWILSVQRDALNDFYVCKMAANMR